MSAFRLVVMSAVVGCSIACGSSNPTPASPSASPPPDGSSTAVTIPTGAERLGNRAFAPDDVTVAAGTTVTWTNTDSMAHTSTSDVGVWNSALVAPGARYSFTFQTPGTYSYHCVI